MLKGTITTLALLLCSLFAVAATSNDKKYKEIYAQYEQYRNNQEFNKGVKCLENAIQYIHADSLQVKSDTYYDLAWSYNKLGQYEKALDYGQKALEMDKQIGLPQNIAVSLALISSIFADQQLYQDAENYMLKAIEYQPKNNSSMLANRYATLGEILSMENKYDEAIEKIEYAYSLDTMAHRMNNVAIRLSQLGEVYLNLKDYKKANELLQQATIALRETKNWSSLCITLTRLSIIQWQLGLTDLSIQSATECLNLSDSIGQIKTKYQSMRHLARLKKSPELYEWSAKLMDTIHNNQVKAQIAEFEVKYNLSEKERENAELQITVERQHHIMTLLTILVIAFLIGGALTFSIYKMRRNIQHTELVARKLFFGKSKVDDGQTATAEPAAPVEENVPLSPREMDILKACCQGKLSKEIADELFISKRTVDAHKSAIYQKLGVSNNTELILYAAKHGIVCI